MSWRVVTTARQLTKREAKVKFDIGASRVRIFVGKRKVAEWEGKVDKNYFIREFATALAVLTERIISWKDNCDGTFNLELGSQDVICFFHGQEQVTFILQDNVLEYDVTCGAVIIAEAIAEQV